MFSSALLASIEDSALLCNSCKCGLLPARTITSPVLLDQLRVKPILSPTEKPFVEDLIREAEHQHFLYDAEISRLQEAKENLEIQRREIERSLEEYRWFIAPMRPLPVELLTKIIRDCCEDSARSSNLVTKPIGLAPYNLGLVCRLWRDIVLSRPKWWSTFSVDLSAATECTSEIANLFIERSKQQPLTIQFRDHCSEDPTESGLHLAAVVAAQSHRIRSLSLSGHTDTIESMAPEDLPLLEFLHLDDIKSYNFPPAALAPNIWSLKLDKLREYHVDDGLIRHEPITCLNLTHVDSSAALEVLESFTNLTDLTMNFISSPDPSPMMCLENLSTLTLTTPSAALAILQRSHSTSALPPLLKSFFDSVELPSLTSVSMIATLSGPAVWDYDDFMGMLTRSRCVLKDLRLENYPIPDHQLLQVLEFAPTLTTLTFHSRDEDEESAFTAALIRRLACSPSANSAIRPDAAILLPMLRSMFLKLPESFEDTRAMTDMIDSRALDSSSGGGVACFEQIEVRIGQSKLKFDGFDSEGRRLF